ncbi:MAG TPA: NUDIX domain-containing protein [Patescibacteria group bacterium]|nr:NUDIX domain-containing protein [Patescibacteria group bacterium]
MHYIQKHILDTLRTVGMMHYAVLNQDEIESGHFRYHVTQLIKDGYIEQIKRGEYRLTAAGKRFVDRLSERRINAMAMPKVITYTLLTDETRIILQEKQKEPYLGLVNMIGGKLHQGETSQQAAVREVREKTGVDIDQPNLTGIFEIIVRDGGQVFTHAMAYVYHLEVSTSVFVDAPVIIVEKKDLPALANLAPDFMHIYNLAQKRSDNVVTKTLLLDL